MGPAAHDASFNFVSSPEKVLAGDWDGNGTDTPGAVTSNGRNRTWRLSNSLSGTVWKSFAYGQSGDQFVVGDWDGNRTATAGIRRGQTWYLSNAHNGVTSRTFAFGNSSDTALAGNYHPDSVDSFEDEGVEAGAAQSSFLALPHPVSAYAPLVYLSGGGPEIAHQPETYFPASARRFFLFHSELKWNLPNWWDLTIAGRGQVRAIRLGASTQNQNPYVTTSRGTDGWDHNFRARDFTRPWDESQDRGFARWNEGFFLNLVGEQYRTGANPNSLDVVPAYYQYEPGGRYITYWFFYPFNYGAAGFNHEGDWERISIKLDAANNPTHVALYRHGCHRVVTWAQISKVPNSTHPIVFSATGTHASYATAGKHEDTCAPIFDFTKATHAWQTWRSLADAEKQPWYGFGGAWGEVGQFTDTTGPLGPSIYKPHGGW